MTSTIFLFLLLGLVIVVAVSAGWAGLRAAPFVPSRGRDTKRIINLAALRPTETFVDLGCGDGRLVLAAAAAGAKAVGYEISVLPWLISWIRAQSSPNRKNIRIIFGDFFHADLSQYDVIGCFLMPKALQKLHDQLQRQPRSGRRVLSYAFQVHGWEPIQKDKPTEKELAVWVYRG